MIGYEVVLSGPAKWNAQQALRGAMVEGVDQVVVVCKDRKLMKQIEKELERQDGLGLSREKVSVKFLGEFVTRVFEKSDSQEEVQI